MSDELFEKRNVYVVTIFLKDEDENGEPLNWSHPSEEYYASTLEEAEKMRERFLTGQDNYYGDLVEDCYISDEPEERELLKPLKPSVVSKLEAFKKKEPQVNHGERQKEIKNVVER